MANNDIVILESILQRKKVNFGDSLLEDEFFELFSFEQILKDYDLSYDELSQGNVDGGDDGGIDGFFFFINDDYLCEEIEAEQLEQYQKNPIINLYLVQSKSSNSFSEIAFDRVITTVQDIFNLQTDIDEIRSYYNSELIERVETFRNVYLDLSLYHPELNISFIYASKGNTDAINLRVQNRADILKKELEELFTGASVKIKFFGAKELLSSSRIEQKYTLQLPFTDSYLSKDDKSYIVLSNLIDYYKFITEDNKILRYIFESNVRDFQGNVEVNKDIQKTLESGENIDFWWLNNGITIIASKASISGKTFTLDNVQIVNGLQTTFSIYNYLKDKNIDEINEERSVSIKIIVINQENREAQDRIIKATNFQTAVQSASLRATDKVQRDIEDYFISEGWYYDRRKNYYKNMGKSADKIISIQYLSQAYMSIILRKPNSARSNPTSLIKSDVIYNVMFNESVNPKVYLFCAKVLKNIDKYLREKSLRHLKNLRFYIAVVSVRKLFGKNDYNFSDITTAIDLEITDELIQKSLEEIISLSESYDGELDKITKTKEFSEYIQNNATDS